ncbi:MAG TPA: translation initiation factor IF-2 [Pirellulales bacterium]|nr:translation initiation factor IF-2 [Pirellulales bacterium]
MAVRIYSLAKELKLDSKDLVDLCTRAGVPGKGSALASLSDEEVAKVKAFVAGANKAPAPRAPAPATAVRATGGATAVAAPPEPPVFRREDYIGPGGVAAKPPVIPPSKPPVVKPERPIAAETSRKPEPAHKPEPKPPAKPAAPAVRLAPLPPSAHTPAAKPAEPEPQKPDIRLPIDAIRASKAGGSKPLQAHMRAHEMKRKAEQQGGPQQPSQPARGGRPGGPGRGPQAPPPAAAPGEGKDRKRTTPGGKLPAVRDDEKVLGGREQRQLNRKRLTTDARPPSLSGEDEPRFRKLRKPKKTGANTAAPRKSHVIVQFPCTVRSFSEALGFRVTQVLGKLLALGTMANINTELSTELVELLAIEFGVEIELRQAANVEEQLLASVASEADAPDSLEPRAPVVTFLGHVDHGKTSLLDRIIGIDVASGESGGITQHIRAYRIEKDGRPITFVDTPGHEAFTQMRARGAKVTDIAVLVVAADDGVMPQTEEAISHARAAEVPIVIALNKTDLPGINYDRIYTQLVTAGLQPTEWGGDVELVKCSALTGNGIDELLETLLTIADLNDYRANPNRAATGLCLEASLHEGRGVVTKLLVQKGTLRVGDALVCGSAYGRVKAIYDTLDTNKTYESVGPSTPVNLTGLDIAPGAGDPFYVLDDVVQAREIAEKRAAESRAVSLSDGFRHVTLETLHERLGGEQAATLNVILRADVRGSIEAIQKELGKLAHPEVQIKVLQATVGGISEADVYLADASDAIIIGFNVVPDEKARSLADDRGVQIRRYDIIYQVTDDLRAALEGMLKPEKRDVELGRALVQRTFQISRVGTIAGCRVLAGTIERNARVRVIRDNRIVGDYPLESLKREKDDAREVREGMECGMKLGGFNDLKEGDILEAYRIEEVARTL